MPRAPRARQPDIAERIRLFAEHHIVAIRTARKNGEIIAVKHATWGWLSPQQYYVMQELHTAAVAILPKIVEGGYRAKAALWETKLEILGFSLPLGGIIPLYATSKAFLSYSEGKFDKMAEWLALEILPFGDILILYWMWLDGTGLLSSINDTLKDFFGQYGITQSFPSSPVGLAIAIGTTLGADFKDLGKLLGLSG